MANAALVCGRHHTIVHQRGWTATVTATGGHLAHLRSPPRTRPRDGRAGGMPTIPSQPYAGRQAGSHAARRFSQDC
ncbi:MAG TPA: hypothetical protein VF825_12990 [Oryzihumus sp.]